MITTGSINPEERTYATFSERLCISFSIINKQVALKEIDGVLPASGLQDNLSRRRLTHHAALQNNELPHGVRDCNRIVSFNRLTREWILFQSRDFNNVTI